MDAPYEDAGGYDYGEDDYFSSGESIYFGKPPLPRDYDYELDGNLTARASVAMHHETSGMELYLRFLNTYLLLLLVIIGCLGNVMSFIAFVVGPLKKQAVSVYLATLAISDTLVLLGLLHSCLEKMVPNFIWMQPWCSLTIYLQYTSSSLSIWILVAFTVERYTAVCFPLWPRKLLNVQQARIFMVLLAGFCMLLFSFVPFTREVVKVKQLGDVYSYHCDVKENFRYAMHVIDNIDVFLTSLLPSLTIVVLNALMIRAVYKAHSTVRGRRHNGGIATAQNTPEPKTPNSDDNVKFFSLRRTPKDQRSHGREQLAKTTKLLVVISSTFVILNIPFGILRVRNSVVHFAHGHDTFGWYVAFRTAQFVFYINFAINFFVYNWCSEAFRKSLMAWCQRTSSRKGSMLSKNKSGSRTMLATNLTIDSGIVLNTKPSAEILKLIDL